MIHTHTHTRAHTCTHTHTHTHTRAHTLAHTRTHTHSLGTPSMSSFVLRGTPLRSGSGKSSPSKILISSWEIKEGNVERREEEGGKLGRREGGREGVQEGGRREGERKRGKRERGRRESLLLQAIKLPGGNVNRQ